MANGLFLVGLAPIVVAIGSYFVRKLEIWDGAGVLVVGLAIMASAPIRRAREKSGGAAQATTFREKSLIIQMGSILLVYGYFGLRLWGQPLTPPAEVVALIGITVSMIAINVTAHIAIALYAGAERTDERDREIGLRGARIGYCALGAAWFAVLVLVVAHAPYPLLFLAVLGAHGLAETIRYGSMLTYYRFGL